MTLSDVIVEGWSTTVSGTFTCDDTVQSGETIQDFIDQACREDLTLTGIGDPTIKGTGADNTLAIFVTDTFGSTDGLTIQDLVVQNPNDGMGIHVRTGNAPATDIDIDNVTIGGIEDQGTGGSAGIAVTHVSTDASIIGNTIDGATSDQKAKGIPLDSVVKSAVIEKNTTKEHRRQPHREITWHYVDRECQRYWAGGLSDIRQHH